MSFRPKMALADAQLSTAARWDQEIAAVCLFSCPVDLEFTHSDDVEPDRAARARNHPRHLR